MFSILRTMMICISCRTYLLYFVTYCHVTHVTRVHTYLLNSPMYQPANMLPSHNLLLGSNIGHPSPKLMKSYYHPGAVDGDSENSSRLSSISSFPSHSWDSLQVIVGFRYIEHFVYCLVESVSIIPLNISELARQLFHSYAG
jgi:hypothetical protein